MQPTKEEQYFTPADESRIREEAHSLLDRTLSRLIARNAERLAKAA